MLIKRHVSTYSEVIIRFTVLETIVCVWRMLRSHHRAYTQEILLFSSHVRSSPEIMGIYLCSDGTYLSFLFGWISYNSKLFFLKMEITPLSCYLYIIRYLRLRIQIACCVGSIGVFIIERQLQCIDPSIPRFGQHKADVLPYCRYTYLLTRVRQQS